MFENVLGQPAAGQLIQDITAGLLAPAMLFSGPPASGKGTTALELGRIISCEEGAEWNCGCSSCARYRRLLHPDLLCLGTRPFSAEIAASAATFLRDLSAAPGNRNQASRLLYVRSIQKLLARFNPILWEDDPKAAKVSALANALEENLDEIDGSSGTGSNQRDSIVKLVDSTLKSAFRLESEGTSDTIPIAQLRRAASWAWLAPAGRRKLLLIENAERMQEEARNSLLKLLEEPPARVSVVLTSSQPASMLPTVLSRLRPYRFGVRDAAIEHEVIRRVFRDEGASMRIGDYLDSFLPVSKETLEAAAAFFAASAAYRAFLLSKKAGRPLAEEVVLLGKYAASLAEAAGLGRPQGDMAQVIALVLEKTEGFEIPSLFTRFLERLSALVPQSLKAPGSKESGEASSFLPQVAYNELWRKCLNWAETAAKVYNLRTAHVMEKLFIDLGRGMALL